MSPLIAADQWTKTSSSSKGYSDLGASHKTRGAVGKLIGGLHLFSPHPCLVTGIQQRRVCGAGSVLSAQGLGLAGFL
jgi:hypothetical protein